MNWIRESNFINCIIKMFIFFNFRGNCEIQLTVLRFGEENVNIPIECVCVWNECHKRGRASTKYLNRERCKLSCHGHPLWGHAQKALELKLYKPYTASNESLELINCKTYNFIFELCMATRCSKDCLCVKWNKICLQ